MKRSLLNGAWAAVCAYCLMNIYLGPQGILATRDARVSVEAMTENIETLRELNDGYSAVWDALRHDARTIALEGRALGYLARDEVAIRLSIASRSASPPGPGKRLIFTPKAVLSESASKLAALAMGLLVVAFGLILSPRRGSSVDSDRI
ncbi:MAG: hypothetical protein E4H20_01830 [Spirochaetales bacterium]|nr:MAG: hypothetical protein E4H20_01830 [Spirochaetales bacterium]